MRRRLAALVAALALAASLAVSLAPAPAEAHLAISHNGCLRHTTYYFDGVINGIYWYHVGIASGANGRNTANLHYSQFPGDPKIWRHTSYSYNCY